MLTHVSEQAAIEESVLRQLLPRPADSHKGTFGTLVALCGSRNMPGAAYLAACGALRSGVGLLKIAAGPELTRILQTRLAEPVWLDPSSLPDPHAMAFATAFLCGCGIGREHDALLGDLLPQIHVPAVYDADCINYFSAHKDEMDRLSGPYVLTPHPVEFSRLTGLSVAEIQQNRAEIAASFAKAHGCVLVLKGKNTVVTSADGEVRINTSGSHALAKGGSGDVLAGVIASLMAQGHDGFTAATIGVYVHGLAGERLAERYGAHGALPSDLPEEIGRILG